MTLAFELPTEIAAGIGAVLLAIAYAIRRIVSRRASPEEQFRVLVLEAMKAERHLQHQIIDLLTKGKIAESLAKITTFTETAKKCSWQDGRIPEQYQRVLEGAMVKFELLQEKMKTEMIQQFTALLDQRGHRRG